MLHAGIDLANSIGTPIYAVSDGVVIDAGPTAGYGMWVKLRHADGTVTLYGHVNTTLVSVGQRVMAGDQIATMGNRGNSTGPHLHFEVLLGGTERIDPVPWLAKRGLYVGNLRRLTGDRARTTHPAIARPARGQRPARPQRSRDTHHPASADRAAAADVPTTPAPRTFRAQPPPPHQRSRRRGRPA